MTTTAPDPDGVTIRRVERADLLDVIRIEKEAFPQPWPYGAFESFLDEPGFLVAVAEPNALGGPRERRSPGNRSPSGEVVGYVVADTVATHRRPVGHVKDLAVRADSRGRGVGATLLRRALSVLASRGVERVKLEVRRGNDRALELYRQFDFEPSHTIPRYYADGEDALVLVVEI